LSPDLPTPQQTRENYLLRLFLLENLLTYVDLRRSYVEYLAGRADGAADQRTTARRLDATCHAWTLCDNLLSIYETLKEKINITQESQRRAIQSRVGSRTITPKIRFHKAIWLYHLLTKLPDDVFERADVDRSHAEPILNRLIERSCATLQEQYAAIATYHRKYRDIASAYKHGRAVFPLRVTFETQPTGTSRLNVHADHGVATVFQRNPDGTETVTEFTPDEESETDLQGILRIATEQLPRLRTYVGSMRTSCEAYIKWLEAGQPQGVGPGPTFCFFAEPYTPEEEALMQALRREARAST
jgi:hypothetical protein